MKTFVYTLAAIVLLAIIVTGIGYALPEEHTTSGERTVSMPPADVFARISDVARFPKWRKDLDRVEVLSSSPLTWREHSGGDVITYEVVESQPPERLVVRIADADLPFGGTWTYELQPSGRDTRLVITEDGRVYNPVFRFMSRFVFGHTASIEKVLQALAAIAPR